eukprot:480441_1
MSDASYQSLLSRAKQNMWWSFLILNLKVGDKIDIFGELKCWYVGVIKQIQKSPNETILKFKMLIHYSYRFGTQTILIDTNDPKWRHLIQPLHTKSRYHYDIDCVSRFYKSQSYSCEICKRQCCSKCFAVCIYDKITNKLVYQCHDCLSISQYKYLFNLIKLIYDSIFRDTNSMIDINIIPLITNYSFTYVSQCHNQIKCCSNIITINMSDKLQNTIMKYIDHKMINLTRTELLFICNVCCESTRQTRRSLSGFLKLEAIYSQCKVFHNGIQKCGSCENKICTKCTDYCEGIDCKNKYHCDKCWILMESNKCINYKKCLNTLCNDCYMLSICGRCKYPICIKCKQVQNVGTSIYLCECCAKMISTTTHRYTHNIGFICSECAENIEQCRTIGCKNNYCDHLVKNTDDIIVTMGELLLELGHIFKVGKIQDLITTLQSQLYELKATYNPPHMLHNNFDSEEYISDIE